MTAPYTWAESIGSSGVGEQRIIEIDIVIPGRTAWEPMMLTVQQARELHAMLGDAIADENPGRGGEKLPKRRHLRTVGAADSEGGAS